MSGLFGGGASAPQTANPLQSFPGYQQAAGTALGDISSTLGGLANVAGGALGNIGETTQNLFGMQAGPAGQAVTGAAQNLSPIGQGFNLGNLASLMPFIGSIGNLPGAANMLLQQGFDPQNALYQRTANQVSDQTLSGEANAGVQGSPYGASVLGNTMNNFNIDWQNNLLNRMLQGAGGAAQTLGSGVGTLGQVLGQGNQALGGAFQSASLPYAAGSSLGNDALGWLNSLIGSAGGAAGIPQQQIQDYLGYMGAGQSAINSYNQSQTANAALQEKINQDLFSNVGSAAGGLGSIFGSKGMFGSGGAFAPGGTFGSLGNTLGSLGKAAAA